MRILENRLDKLMIKHNEAINIKKTYQVILQRFKEEQQDYEAQLAQLEKALNAKNSDLQDLVKMSKEANKVQQMSEKDLQSYKLE